jgi:hypothetical protein
MDFNQSYSSTQVTRVFSSRDQKSSDLPTVGDIGFRTGCVSDPFILGTISREGYMFVPTYISLGLMIGERSRTTGCEVDALHYGECSCVICVAVYEHHRK